MLGFYRMRAVFSHLLFFVAALPLPAQSVNGGAALNRTPFDQWAKDRADTSMGWSLHVRHAELTWHQRLLVPLEAQIGIGNLTKRPRNAQLVIYVQVQDSSGVRYHHQDTVNVSRMEDSDREDHIEYSQLLFVRPGDYQVSAVLYDPASGERSVRQTRFRVPELSKDPFPELWKPLPTVQFLDAADPPDLWFQPQVRQRLPLVAKPGHALKVDVLANLTPSEHLSASLRVQHRNLSILLPVLKVLAGLECGGSHPDICLMDLSRRRIAFEQRDAQALNWPALRESLSNANPATIDYRSLWSRSLSAAYFVGQVERRLGPSKALIVISRPLSFRTAQAVDPPRRPMSSDYRLYYIRLMPPPPPARLAGWGGAHFRQRRMRLDHGGAAGSRDDFDSMVKYLQPLAPRVFDVDSPAQFRKALAAIVVDLGRA